MALMSPAASPEHKRILVIDDDTELRQLLATYLQNHGYEVRTLPDARGLERALDKRWPHLLVLDLMLPGEDGLSVCRRLRGSGDAIPIVMLTARDETVDRIVGLEMGADDYLGKPFDPRELAARIEAVLRRKPPPPSTPQPEAERFSFGAFAFDAQARLLCRGNEQTALTSGEFALLNVFVRHAYQPLTRERLLELARGSDSESFDRSIDVQVHRLRKLIEEDPTQPRYIQTVWGHGYVFVPEGKPR
jgi:two-component system phosphate regulon response regulator OmpR